MALNHQAGIDQTTTFECEARIGRGIIRVLHLNDHQHISEKHAIKVYIVCTE